jgi:hypothetical protein
MRTIDEIVAATLKTTEASIREAFEAGRAHTAATLKTRMTAFFEGLMSDVEGETPTPPAPPPEEAPHSDHGGDSHQEHNHEHDGHHG